VVKVYGEARERRPPTLQFLGQSVPPPQIVTVLGKGFGQGPKPECTVPPPQICTLTTEHMPTVISLGINNFVLK